MYMQLSKNSGKYLMAIIISLVSLIIIGLPTQSFAVNKDISIDESLLPNDQKIISKTTYNLAPGITETELITNVSSGEHQNIDYICEVDMSGGNTKVASGYKDYTGTKWGMQSTSKQAVAYEKANSGDNVVAGINADFFDMASGAPLGALVMNGNIYHDTNSRPYFAILKDGTAVIREGNVPLDDVKEAVGGLNITVKDGKVCSDIYEDGRLYSRQALGIKKDGTVVSLTTHGVNYPLSCGRTFTEIAHIMVALGCDTVINLDGGGSTTLSTQREGSDVFTMRNASTDGTERNVSSTLFFISTAKSDGEFDHFSVTPNNEIYTQGSEVQFESVPVDSSGKRIDDNKIPSDIKWELDDSSKEFGSISKTGVFSSNGEEGTVIARLVSTNGEILGENRIIICAPDSITWEKEEASLGFDDSSDLGLIAKWNGRNVNIKDGDFKWKFEYDEEFIKEGPGNKAKADIGALKAEAKKGGTAGNDIGIKLVDNSEKATGAVKLEVYVGDELKESYESYYKNSQNDKNTYYITDASELNSTFAHISFVSNYVSFTGSGKLAPTDGIIRLTGGTAPTSDLVGTFEGNIFKSKGITANGTITATYTYNGSEGVSGTVKAIIGRLPSIVMDYEDQIDSDGNKVAATDYWTFDKALIEANGGTILAYTDNWGDSNYRTSTDKRLVVGQYATGSAGNYNVRGGNSSAAIVSNKEDSNVRFGNSALRINYDFSKIVGIEGACVGFSQQSQEIQGNPTGIGLWVYAPENTPNLWLRIRLLDANNNVVTLNFTERMNDAYNNSGGKNYGGINWSGWKYVEADLRGATGPFKLLGGETIRIMQTNGAYGVSSGKGMGDFLADGTLVERANCKGYILCDNLSFVYGANTEDVDAPVIDFISANNEDMEDGMEINDNTVSFKSAFHDVQNRNTKGINYDSIKVRIDGKLVGEYEDSGSEAKKYVNFNVIEADNELRLDNVLLCNGRHTISISLKDNWGNETTETRTFNVNGDINLTTGYVDNQNDSPVLNQEYKLYLKSNNVEDVDSIGAKIKLSEEYSNNLDVVFSDGWEGEFIQENEEITIAADRKLLGFDEKNPVIATITVKIPSNLNSESKFAYTVTAGVLNVKSEYPGDSVYPEYVFAAPTKKIQIEAGLSVIIDDLEVGDSGKKLYVYDRDGNAVAKANIYNSETGELFTTTNYKGYADITDLCENPSKYSLFAEKDGQYSFSTEGQSFALGGGTDASPMCITANANAENSTSKLFTWLSNPGLSKTTAIVQVAEAEKYDADGERAFTSYEGKSEKYVFTKSLNVEENKSVRINEAKATGLKADINYVYRVGDGHVWSDVDTFTLTRKNSDVNMFIVGDTQAEDTSVMDVITSSLNNSGKKYSLGMQTGDLIENAGLYSDWIKGLNLFKGLNTDFLHVVGNHELFGDAFGDVSQKVFALNNKKYYSVEYGNVYVAAINYTEDRSQYDEAFEWLAKDAAQSNAQWKLLVMHQPAYYTNPNGGNGYVHDKLPAAAEKGGIDFVFSGHDHAYARTAPLYQGNIDEKDGIVYFVCGSTGEKSYTAVNNKDFHFEILDQDYDAIYITLSANDKEFIVETHESDGTVIDTYKKESSNECASEGHKYIYDGTELVCSECSYSIELKGFTGWVVNSDNQKMYFIDGKYQTGWKAVGSQMCYFDAAGIMQEVQLKEEVETTCMIQGYKLYYCKTADNADGKEFRQKLLKGGGHEYNSEEICTVCGWKKITLDDCDISIKQNTYSYTGKEIKPIVTVKTKGKNGLVLSNPEEYRTYYSDNIKCGKASIRIEPRVNMYVNLTEERGTLGPGDKTISFTIAPAAVSNLKSDTISSSAIKLKWNNSAGADGYLVSVWNSVKGKYVLYKKITDATQTSIIVKDRKAGYTYKFRIKAYADTKDGMVLGSNKYVSGITKPYKVEYLKLKAGTKSITASWNKRACTGYQVRYSSTSNFNSYKTITVKGNANVSKKISKLKTGKKYYVKVRAYKSLTGYKTVYGNWSAVRSVVVK